MKQTAPGPHCALLVHSTKVHIGSMRAAPSVVDTQKHPIVLSHGWRQPVPPPQVSAHVGIQKARGVMHSPSKQTVPDGQHVAAVGPEQQESADAQHSEPVRPSQTLLTSPLQRRQAWLHEA